MEPEPRSHGSTLTLESGPRSGSDPRAARAAQRPLDRREGIATPTEEERGCERWPEHLRLWNRSQEGERAGLLVKGCCKATNQCETALRKYRRETVEMLKLDAMEWPPTIYAVLTAREFLKKDDDLRRTLEKITKSVRRRWPSFEYYATWEEQKRGALHVNLAVKGVPKEDAQAFGTVLVKRWCDRVDAEPAGQYVEEIADGEAVMLYIQKRVGESLARSRHGLKASQQPKGWRNKHRTSQTRGYLVRPAAVMREEARESLRRKDRLHRAFRRCLEITDGHDPPSEMVEHVYEQFEAEDLRANWGLVTVAPLFPGPVLAPDYLRLMREAALAPFRARERERPPRADVSSGPGSVGGGGVVPGDAPERAPRVGVVPACRSG